MSFSRPGRATSWSGGIGRRTGLKIPGTERFVPVRSRPSADVDSPRFLFQGYILQQCLNGGSIRAVSVCVGLWMGWSPSVLPKVRARAGGKKQGLRPVSAALSVPEAGIEPARGRPRWILSPVRLPVSPLRRHMVQSTQAAVAGQAFSFSKGSIFTPMRNQA